MHLLKLYVYSQIVSTYQTPDAGELNYHAGTASRSPSCNLTAIHSGVQFTDLQHTDLCTAILLLVTCKFPTKDLANIRFDINSSKDAILNFIESGDILLKFDATKQGHCKTIRNKIR